MFLDEKVCLSSTPNFGSNTVHPEKGLLVLQLAGSGKTSLKVIPMLCWQEQEKAGRLDWTWTDV